MGLCVRSGNGVLDLKDRAVGWDKGLTMCIAASSFGRPTAAVVHEV